MVLVEAMRVRKLMPDLAVIGLHTIVEHHEATGPDAPRTKR